MLDFNTWEKTHFIYLEKKDNPRGELRIHPRTQYINISGKSVPTQVTYRNCIKENKIVSFEKAFQLAKEGKRFHPSDDLNSYLIYFELQSELERELQEYTQLYVKYFNEKPRLDPPENADERLRKQYLICNALFGYQEDIEGLPKETKANLETLRKVANNVLQGGIGKPKF